MNRVEAALHLGTVIGLIELIEHECRDLTEQERLSLVYARVILYKDVIPEKVPDARRSNT